MPTDRPRLQAYVEPAIHDSFLKWKQERGLTKDSEALNQLLAEYFGVSSQLSISNSQSSIPQNLIEEMINERIAGLERKIELDYEKLLPKLVEGATVAYSIHWIEKLNKLAERLEAVEDSLEVVLSESPVALGDSLEPLEDTRSPDLVPEMEAPGLEEENGSSADVEGDAGEELVESPPVAIESDSDSLASPFAIGEAFIWDGEKVRVDRIVNSKLYCRYLAEDESALAFPISFAQAREIKGLSELADSPDLATLLSPLTQSELAKRLGIHKSTISHRKGEEDFEEWSKERDPDAIAWRYDREEKLFVPKGVADG